MVKLCMLQNLMGGHLKTNDLCEIGNLNELSLTRKRFAVLIKKKYYIYRNIKQHMVFKIAIWCGIMRRLESFILFYFVNVAAYNVELGEILNGETCSIQIRKSHRQTRKFQGRR